MKPLVAKNIGLTAVLSSVHFNNDLAFVTDKISDECTHRDLSSELAPLQT